MQDKQGVCVGLQVTVKAIVAAWKENDIISEMYIKKDNDIKNNIK